MVVILNMPLGIFEVGIGKPRFYEAKIKSQTVTAKRIPKEPEFGEPADGIQFGILYPVGKELRLDILATENEEKAGEIMIRRVYEPPSDLNGGKQYKKAFLVQALGSVGMMSIFSGTRFFRPQGAKT